MSTDQHSALKKLTGGPCPCVSVKLVDKEHVQKHLGPRAKAAEADEGGWALVESVRQHHAAKPHSKPTNTFVQGPVPHTSQFPYSAIGICLVH
jgi:hypothetical protein